MLGSLGTGEMSQTLVSFVTCASNDGYGGNFIWRLETALNYLSDNLDKIGRLKEAEVIIADWGSEIPLNSVISLSPAARLITRFVLVPPLLATKLDGDSQFVTSMAVNTAVRRSCGDYVIDMNGDVLLTRKMLDKIFQIIDNSHDHVIPVNRSMLMSRRKNIPYTYVNNCPNLKEIDWFIRCVGSLLPSDLPLAVRNLPFYYYPAGFLLMSRWLWEDCRGHDEELRHYGFQDTDLIRRVNSKFPCVYMDVVGLTVFHLDHRRGSGGFKPDRPINIDKIENIYCPNDETWGLRSYDLEKVASFVNAEGNDILGREVEHTVPFTRALVFAVTKVVAAWFISQIGVWPRRAWLVCKEVQSNPFRLWVSVLLRVWTEWRNRQRGRRINEVLKD